MSMVTVGIIDYQAGNLQSVYNSVLRTGAECKILKSPCEIDTCDKIILPGVGSFKHESQTLKNEGWTQKIIEANNNSMPLLGICLGMQLLFDIGYENGVSEGLGLIKGRVCRIEREKEVSIPHVGWNDLKFKLKHPVFKGVRDKVDFYFVHSYECVPEMAENIVSMTDYFGDLVSSVHCSNVVGVQFHPEKSQPAGLRIISNFVNCDKLC